MKAEQYWGGGGAHWSVLPEKKKQGKLKKQQENCKIKGNPKTKFLLLFLFAVHRAPFRQTIKNFP